MEDEIRRIVNQIKCEEAEKCLRIALSEIGMNDAEIEETAKEYTVV